MTNKILDLADAYANRDTRTDVELKARTALATEVQAHIDYTRAVISERDAYKTSLKATKGEVYRLLSERDTYQMAFEFVATAWKEECDALRAQVMTYVQIGESMNVDFDKMRRECDAVRKANLDCVDHFNAIRVDYENLRKAAQMALDALDFLDIDDEIPNGAVEALRKELGE